MPFNFSVQLNDPTDAGGSADPVLVYDLQQALSVWSQYVTGNGTLVVALDILNTTQGRAAGGPTSSVFDGTNSQGLDIEEPSSLYELTTGNHVAGTTSDITITLDPGYFSRLDLSNNLTYNSQVANNTYNPIVLDLNEIFHGFGQAGYYSQTGILSGNYESTFDNLIQITSSGAFFIGTNAEAAYGGAVPLTTNSSSGENYYHFGNDQADLYRIPSTVQDPLTLDLMNGIVFFYNYQYPVSNLDLGVLRDLGYNVACFCRGTLILTERGEVAVEELAIGDRVMTLSGRARPIRWIGRRSYAGRFAVGQRHILPVCVTAGAIADGVPRRDLWLSPNHALYLEGVLIEARDLVNGVSIVQAERVAAIQYFHIELDSHDVILAEGAPAESFIDDDSRGLFHNAHEYQRLYPDEAADPARYCAPRRDQGFEVERARAGIARRAGLGVIAEAPAPGLLRGQIEEVGRRRICGWAQDMANPDAPVCLDILAGGQLIGQAVANRYRADLAAAGLGSLRHGFEFELPAGGVLIPRSIQVRRSLDGAPLTAARRPRTASAS